MFLLTVDNVSFLIFVIFLLFYIFFTSKNTFKLLVISELFWITFYATVLFIALVFDNLYILSLSFFFLMFSAAELSLGVSTFFLQKSLYQSLAVGRVLSNKATYL